VQQQKRLPETDHEAQVDEEEPDKNVQLVVP